VLEKSTLVPGKTWMGSKTRGSKTRWKSGIQCKFDTNLLESGEHAPGWLRERDDVYKLLAAWKCTHERGHSMCLQRRLCSAHERARGARGARGARMQACTVKAPVRGSAEHARWRHWEAFLHCT
jgi:hypothetical protein